MGTGHPEDDLEAGIRFARAGNFSQAEIVLLRAVQSQPKSAKAWFWLGQVIQDSQKKAYCLARARTLDPQISARIRAEENFTVTQPSPLEPVSPGIENSQPGRPGETPPSKATDSSRASKFSIHPGLFLTGLLLALLIVGIPLILLILLGGLVRYLPAREAAAIPQDTLLPITATPLELSATDTPTATFTLTPTLLPTLTSTLPATPTMDSQARLQSIADDMAAAKSKMSQKDYPGAILILDRIIMEVPDDTDAYYERGKAYYKMTDGLTSESEYKDYLKSAIADFDEAISLGPVLGDYLIYRGYAIWTYAMEFEMTSDREPLLGSALDNLQTGFDMGTSLTGVPIDIADLNHDMGQCQTALNQYLQIAQSGSLSSDEEETLNELMAENYLCLGSYQKALDKIDQADICDSCVQYDKEEILYSLGKKDQALDILNTDIQQNPGFFGSRYYLRALIYFDQKKYDLAEKDLETGYGNTWWHGGLFYYVEGKLALLDGQTETGRQLLQYADASVLRYESPVIINRIHADALALGGEPLSMTPQSEIYVTPFPQSFLETMTPEPTPIVKSVTQQATPSPDTGLLPPYYVEAITVDFNSGTGPVTLKPGDFPLYHFVLKSPISFNRATKLVFRLLPEQGTKPTLQVDLWANDGGWGMVEPIYGDTEVQHPSAYIGKTGDFYVAIHNYSPDQTVSFDNVGFIVTVLNYDGSSFTYGLSQAAQ